MIDPELRLRRAINMGSLPAVRRILKSHAHLIHNVDDGPQGDGNTNLHLAVLHNRVAIVELLVKLGHEDNNISVNRFKETPLHIAARNGYVEIVNLLVCLGEKIAGINKRDIEGRDAVMLAAAKGHDTVVQLLLTFAPLPPKDLPHFLAVKPFSNARPSTASSATDPHHPQNPARVLLMNQDAAGNTALHHATSHGEMLVQRTLLAAGANPDIRNCNSWLPIDYSATHQAQAYFKNLVAEHERDYVAAKQRRAQFAEMHAEKETGFTNPHSLPSLHDSPPDYKPSPLPQGGLGLGMSDVIPNQPMPNMGSSPPASPVPPIPPMSRARQAALGQLGAMSPIAGAMTPNMGHAGLRLVQDD